MPAPSCVPPLLSRTPRRTRRRPPCGWSAYCCWSFSCPPSSSHSWCSPSPCWTGSCVRTFLPRCGAGPGRGRGWRSAAEAGGGQERWSLGWTGQASPCRSCGWCCAWPGGGTTAPDSRSTSASSSSWAARHTCGHRISQSRSDNTLVRPVLAGGGRGQPDRLAGLAGAAVLCGRGALGGEGGGPAGGPGGAAAPLRGRGPGPGNTRPSLSSAQLLAVRLAVAAHRVARINLPLYFICRHTKNYPNQKKLTVSLK